MLVLVKNSGFRITSVSTLFGWCGPLNVARFIVSIYILAVNRVSWGGLTPQLGKELPKAAKAKFDPSPAIGIVAVGIRIITSLFRGMVRTIFRCPPSLARLAVRYISRAKCFLHKTSAGSSTAGSKVRTSSFRNFATVASAEPMAKLSLVKVTRKSKHRQLPESLALQVQKSRVCWFGREVHGCFYFSTATTRC